MICDEQKSVLCQTLPGKINFLRSLNSVARSFLCFVAIFMATAFFYSITSAQEITEVVPLVSKYLYELRGDKNQEGELNQPAGLALDRDGNIYTADTVNSRIVVFSANGKLRQVFGKPGSGVTELNAPMALAVDSERKLIYVSDSSNYRIQVFKTDGTFVKTIDPNKQLTDETKKVRPLGIAVNSKGQIYFSDADNHYIRVYAPEGNFLFRFGGFGNADGQFAIPVGLAIDKQDKVYAVDMNNSRVQVFDSKGQFLLKMGSAGDAKGNFGKPKDICVNDRGYIFVSDGTHLVVQIFDSKGTFVDLIGADHDKDLQFASPFGLATHNEFLYVTDRWRNSIRVYEVQI